jgi:hypothetical protein
MIAEDIPIRILKIVRSDIYDAHPRAFHEKLLTGQGMQALHAEIERMQGELDEQAERVEACPHCNARMTHMGYEDVAEAHTILEHKSFGCGYSETDGYMSRPCPRDPKFPKLEDYELITRWDSNRRQWWAVARPKTKMASLVSMPATHGDSEDEARVRLIERYRSITGSVNKGY